MQNPAPILNNIFEFVFSVSTLDGTILQRRINEVSASIEHQFNQSNQKLQSSSSILQKKQLAYKANGFYNAEQIQFMLSKLANYLDFFGYK